MGSEPLFTTRTEWRNRVANVALVGEFDLAGVPTLEKDLAPVESNGVRAILLDLRELTSSRRSGARRRTATNSSWLARIRAHGGCSNSPVRSSSSMSETRSTCSSSSLDRTGSAGRPGVDDEPADD
jgi:hypothetical protein